MDRNTIVAFLLIALILILTPLYIDLITPDQPPDQEKPAAPVTTRPAAEPEMPRPASQPPGPPAALAEAPEHSFRVEHPLYSAAIASRRGGSIASFRLHQYLSHDSSRVELIYSGNRENLALSFVSALDGQTVSLHNGWHSAAANTDLNITTEPRSLVFYTLFNNRRIEKTLTFHPHSYRIDVRINLTPVAELVSQGTFTLAWPGGLPATEKNLKDDVTYFKGYVYQGGELHTPKARAELKMDRYIGQTDWVAVRTKYFIAALIPDLPAPSAALGGIQSNGEKFKRSIYSAALEHNANRLQQVTLYLGPLEYQRVKGLNVRLERVMNFGWSFIRPISKGVLYLLTKMHAAIPNYGVVLIIFSILVKILVYPLTKKSYLSTKDMQALQPLIAELREKHKNNPQKLNQETMKLYKEHGVNPLGGCLPLLLQMPLLFALFQVFRSTIELRGAHFIWWIRDLSSPDTILYLPFNLPLYGDQVSVLPLIMGVTMFIQQKMMPSQPGAQQKFMSYFMTVFFVLLFNNFPSGLNLYYTLFNLFTILQQKYLTPHHPAVPLKQPAAARRKKS